LRNDDDLKHAPWTPEQVEALNKFQHSGRFHPFTCGKRSDHNNNDILVATPAGWVCPYPGCDYTQGWAHDFMADQTIFGNLGIFSEKPKL